jgi:hypothetical protein
MSESVILCEGYHDRAFWAGWLEWLGCLNLGRPSGKTGRIRVRDPWNLEVSDGEFAFHSRNGRFLRIVPCRGKDRILPTAESRLKDRVDKELLRLVISVDADEIAGAVDSTRPGSGHQALEALLQQFGELQRNEHAEFLLNGGATVVSVVRWEASDAPTSGLPNQQTLERVAAAAVVAAYPDRGPAVQGWLDSRPDGPQAGPKEFGWSFMAGWYAEHGCEAFYRLLWADAAIARQLQSRLHACGAWRVAEALAE